MPLHVCIYWSWACASLMQKEENAEQTSGLSEFVGHAEHSVA
jgi:hypothetical protein